MRIGQYAEHIHGMIVGHRLIMLITLIGLILPVHGYAQQQSSPKNSDPITVLARSPLLDSPEVLRLEQTIRANKEQPQVLTIVPWQLPTHQRINETNTWQPLVEQLPNIERNQFLRDLAVVDDILSESAKDSVK